MNSFGIFVGESFGTMLLVLLGNGVVANVLLEKSKGQNSGWIVITAGWGVAVAVAVYVAGWVSGAHINPAVTFGFLVIGKVSAGAALVYLAGQMAGAFVGAALVWLVYLPHWRETADPAAKLAAFATAPAIRRPLANLLAEVIGTAVLLIGVLGIAHENNGLAGGLAPALVGMLVFGIGLSLGGPTGYAINPARDLAPRLAHALLPIAGKGGSDWSYAPIPVLGPLLGGALGAGLYQAIFSRLVA